jgi:hypothetical protein
MNRELGELELERWFSAIGLALTVNVKKTKYVYLPASEPPLVPPGRLRYMRRKD